MSTVTQWLRDQAVVRDIAIQCIVVGATAATVNIFYWFGGKQRFGRCQGIPRGSQYEYVETHALESADRLKIQN